MIEAVRGGRYRPHKRLFAMPGGDIFLAFDLSDRSTVYLWALGSIERVRAVFIQAMADRARAALGDGAVLVLEGDRDKHGAFVVLEDAGWEPLRMWRAGRRRDELEHVRQRVATIGSKMSENGIVHGLLTADCVWVAGDRVAIVGFGAAAVAAESSPPRGDQGQGDLGDRDRGAIIEISDLLRSHARSPADRERT